MGADNCVVSSSIASAHLIVMIVDSSSAVSEAWLSQQQCAPVGLTNVYMCEYEYAVQLLSVGQDSERVEGVNPPLTP